MKVYDNISERLLVKNKNPKLYSRLVELGCEPKWAKKLDPNEIITDQGIYPREKTDLSQVDIYASDMENGDEFPTIIVTITPEGHYLLVDGNHRLLAARKAGLPVNAELWDIPAHYIDYVATIANTIGRGKQGKDLSGAVKYKKIVEAYTSGKNRDIKQLAEDFETSVKYVRNVLSKAGIIRSEKEELQKEAERLYDEGYSITEIAEELGKDKSTISRWVAKFTQVKNATPEELTPETHPEPEEQEETSTYTPPADLPLTEDGLIDPDEMVKRVMATLDDEEEEQEEQPKKKSKGGRPKDDTKFNRYNAMLNFVAQIVHSAKVLPKFENKAFALKILANAFYLVKYDIEPPPTQLLIKKEYWKELPEELIQLIEEEE